MTRIPIVIMALVGLAACSTPLTSEQMVAATATAGRIQQRVDSVQAACAEALPIARIAGVVPVIGTYIAEGVRVGCGSADGIAALVERPGSAQWLGEQIQMMKAGLGRRQSGSAINAFLKR